MPRQAGLSVRTRAGLLVTSGNGGGADGAGRAAASEEPLEVDASESRYLGGGLLTAVSPAAPTGARRDRKARTP